MTVKGSCNDCYIKQGPYLDTRTTFHDKYTLTLRMYLRLTSALGSMLGQETEPLL